MIGKVTNEWPSEFQLQSVWEVKQEISSIEKSCFQECMNIVSVMLKASC